jgi:hypothetical protein
VQRVGQAGPEIPQAERLRDPAPHEVPVARAGASLDDLGEHVHARRRVVLEARAGPPAEPPAREAREALRAVEELVGPERRVRKACGVREQLLDRDAPSRVPNSGTIAATRSSGSSLPSWISSQAAAEVIALVAENTT